MPTQAESRYAIRQKKIKNTFKSKKWHIKMSIRITKFWHDLLFFVNESVKIEKRQGIMMFSLYCYIKIHKFHF